ncbi:hypothetical protein D9M68_511760 [compost metagenome]
MGLGVLAGAQQLHAGADGGHDRAARGRVDVFEQDAVVGAAGGGARIAAQRLVGGLPFVLEKRRIRLGPAGDLRPQRRVGPGGGGVVHRIGHGLVQVGVHGVEARFHRIDQRDIQAVLPDTGGAVLGHAMLVPGAVGCQHEIVRAQRHLVAVHHGERAPPFHDEAQRRMRMLVGGSEFARLHDLQARIQPTHGGGHVAPAWIVQIDHAPARLFGGNQLGRTQHVAAQVLVAPHHRHRHRARRPRFDLVRHRPQGAGLQARQLLVVGDELGRVGHIGAAYGVLAVRVIAVRFHPLPLFIKI